MNHDPQPGSSHPLGATVCGAGTNFSLFSRSASRVELVFFDGADDTRPCGSVELNPDSHRTYHYWHAFVPGIQPGQLYGYRVHGPSDPARGMRFDPTKVLLDPYGRGVVVPSKYDRRAAEQPGDNAGVAMKSVVADPAGYDWQGDAPLRQPSSRTVIYEMHVGGFTRHPNSGVTEAKRGTYAGMIDKIPYLQELGVTAVELLPVFQFDALDCPPGRVNFWGYAPVAFFAPHQAYSSRQDPLGPLDEFRDLVKALHRAGIEVILDVVFNHTAEGNHDGPTLCFRGIENSAYYILEPDRSRYANYSGTGNTFNANHPVVRRLILDSLRYWVGEMHVDGFRFDLASILARDESGHVLPNPPILWDIESDPLLAGTKLIAEAWDAAGLYQVVSNPPLTELITSRVGDGWLRDLDQLRQLEPLAQDPAFRQEWRAVKLAAKRNLAVLIEQRTGIKVNPESLFDIQAKRLHEYKRQHLSALHILTLYLRLKKNPQAEIPARTFLFGAKAAPGYRMAKLIIKLINSIGDVANNDPDVNGRLKVVFFPDYNVKNAQHIYPAADLSEQISTAGLEASGTGNMKFAMNGALTIGTLDGANVEIREEVGDENFFLFGLTAEEVQQKKAQGYRPRDRYEQSAELREVLDFIASGALAGGDADLFRPLVDNLLESDPFLVLEDYQAYIDCQEQVSRLWSDAEAWTRTSILNAARMGKFSSDRSIRDYCRQVWNIHLVPTKGDRKP